MQAYIDRRQITQFLNSIREAGDRASHIVSNMLNFSRGKVTHHVPTNLNELLDNTIELVGHDYDLKRHYDFSRIKLAREYGDNLPLVPCSPVEIQQVMINLLKNATQALLDHTPPISTPMITIRTQFRDDMVLVEIEDNGPGMDEATRKRVFEPFFTTKEVGRGTGLGLSVSYFIVTTHHSGLMNVVSHRGEGCCFSIGLPLKP
jgi:signal transduction histidine kinase